MKTTHKKILYIHNEKKMEYGSHFINNLIVTKLRKKGYLVHSVYPKASIDLFSRSLDGISSILFFYSLISEKENLHKYDIIQGTTYTTLAFLGNDIPIVSLFGSTTYGYLKNTPSIEKIRKENINLAKIFNELKNHDIIDSLKSRVKSLRDINKIEIDVAKKSDLVIATSDRVKKELTKNKLRARKTVLIHNAIEDFWFRTRPVKKVKPVAELLYLGRMGNDLFTIKLKGIDRLILVLKEFPGLCKTVIGMCRKSKEYKRFFSQYLNTYPMLNIAKRKIPRILRRHYGDIYINPGRYEGFCLSLIEAMSQGLVPVSFPVGVAPEIISNGKNGYLVTTIEGMIRKIEYLTTKKAKRKKMAQQAMQTSKLFTSHTLLQKYIAVYKKLNKKEKNKK